MVLHVSYHAIHARHISAAMMLTTSTSATYLSRIATRRRIQRVGPVVANTFRKAYQVIFVVEHDVVVPHHVRPQHAPHGLRQVDPVIGNDHDKTKRNTDDQFSQARQAKQHKHHHHGLKHSNGDTKTNNRLSPFIVAQPETEHRV